VAEQPGLDRLGHDAGLLQHERAELGRRSCGAPAEQHDHVPAAVPGLELGRQRFGVVRRHEKTGLAVRDELPRASDVGRDDGAAGPSGLEQGTRHPFARGPPGEAVPRGAGIPGGTAR